tara:strand:+ start:2504 stop:2821 length:318 start_codon:yes stop_codon:yes gene_type:complete
MESKLKNVDEYIQEAIANIKNDRSITSNLLSDLVIEIKKSQPSTDVHKDLGQIAAKYVETLQRSNEQLVKITALLHKQTSKQEDLSLSSKDKDELFDLIQGNVNG